MSGLPLEHVLGWARFHGLRIAVDAGVFVPRRRTEFLVALAAAAASRPVVVVDLCCGSGALGAALATLPEPNCTPPTSNPPPCAALGAMWPALGGRVPRGDLFDPLRPALRGRVDILAANVPYVTLGDRPDAVGGARPRAAGGPGRRGGRAGRRCAGWPPRRPAGSPGGKVLIETSERQAPVVAEIFAAAGLSPAVTTADGDVDATVVLGRLPAG